MRAPTATYSRKTLIRLLVDLLEPARRQAAISELSQLLAVDSFVVFVPDAEIGRLLAAPGFPQTFPDRKVWSDFIATTKTRQAHRGSLPWPEPNTLMPAVGMKVGDAAVLIVLGGRPDPEQVEELSELIQLIVPGLTCERTLATVGVQLQLAHQATRESSALAASLDEARRAAQNEVAARKKAESDLRHARDELARTNLDLEDRVRERTERLHETISELEAFSYTVSHDLRAPLRAMYGYSDALTEVLAARLAPEEKEQLARISRAAHRLDGMIRDVLRYSRVSRAEITLRPMDLTAAIQTVIDENEVLRPFADRVKVVGPVPMIKGHEMLLEQCIANLLLNAVKFVERGVPPQVRILAEKRGNIVRVWFEDNGIGIAPEQTKRLFAMFERIHPASLFEGNGVGLAIVKRAATRLGGDVGVESGPGAGSRFWLDLQRA